MTTEKMDSLLKKVRVKNDLQMTARVAGIIYLSAIASGMLAMFLGKEKYIIEGDSVATFISLKENQSNVHFTAIYDICMFSSVFALAVALYLLVEKVNRGLALVAMVWRVGEGVFGLLMVLLDNLALMVLFNESDKPGRKVEDVIWIYDILCGLQKQTLTIVFILLGLGTQINFYLFYKKKMVPNWLSILGMVAFFVSSTTALINIAIETDILMMFQAPAVIFEFVVGFWLIVYGVNTSNN